MHKSSDEMFNLINPFKSVAVDTLWRATIGAMGWDVPCMPDGTKF
jgi:hypothetical protein